VDGWEGVGWGNTGSHVGCCWCEEGDEGEGNGGEMHGEMSLGCVLVLKSFRQDRRFGRGRHHVIRVDISAWGPVCRCSTDSNHNAVSEQNLVVAVLLATEPTGIKLNFLLKGTSVPAN